MCAATDDVQKVDVSVEDEDIVVVCQFANGTTANGCKVEILSLKNVSIISRFVSFKCTFKHSTLCSVNTSFSKSELDGFSNFTIVVYDWEKDGSTTRVFSTEFARTTPHPNTPLLMFTTDAVVNKIQENWGKVLYDTYSQ